MLRSPPNRFISYSSEGVPSGSDNSSDCLIPSTCLGLPLRSSSSRHLPRQGPGPDTVYFSMLQYGSAPALGVSSHSYSASCSSSVPPCPHPGAVNIPEDTATPLPPSRLHIPPRPSASASSRSTVPPLLLHGPPSPTCLTLCPSLPYFLNSHLPPKFQSLCGKGCCGSSLLCVLCVFQGRAGKGETACVQLGEAKGIRGH